MEIQPFDEKLRKEAVNKGIFASLCGINDIEYNSHGIPKPFRTDLPDLIQPLENGTFYCTQHEVVLPNKVERYSHWYQEHNRVICSTRKNGQFKRKFASKSLRAMRNAAK